jgi:hypothetical protein
VNRRILNRLIAAVAFAAAAGYLFSLLPKATTPDEVYWWPPILVVGVVLLVIEMVLLARQSEEDRRSNRKVWNDSNSVAHVAWTDRSSIGLWLASAGVFIAWRTGRAVDFHGTVWGLAFVEVVIALAFASWFCGFLVISSPRRAVPGLFILGGLLIVAAAVAPLVRPLGDSWSARGFRPTYLLAASGVFVLTAGVFARIEARRLRRATGLRAAAEGGS